MSTNAPTFTELLTTISAAGAARRSSEQAQADGPQTVHRGFTSGAYIWLYVNWNDDYAYNNMYMRFYGFATLHPSGVRAMLPVDGGVAVPMYALYEKSWDLSAPITDERAWTLLKQAPGTTPAPTPREPSSAPSGALPGPFSVPGFESLAAVLTEAYDQAALGKGAERHGKGAPFDEQPMQDLIRLYGTGFALGQAAKKAQEAQRLPTVDRQVRELLGAIVYIAGAIIHIQESA